MRWSRSAAAAERGNGSPSSTCRCPTHCLMARSGSRPIGTGHADGEHGAMSEYQYYEFQAIDRPLSERERRELRACSTRATITSTRFVNHYEWGDLKGDPRVWIEKSLDASSRAAALHVPTASLAIRRCEAA